MIDNIYGLGPQNRCDKCEGKHWALVDWMRRRVLFATLAGGAFFLWVFWEKPLGVHTGVAPVDLILTRLSLGFLAALGAGVGATIMIMILSGIPGVHATQLTERDHCVDCGAVNVRS